MQKQNRRNIILICAALVITTLIAFEPVRHNDFVDYDDDKYVTKNPHILAGITRESVIWAFTKYHFGMWHPLTSLSHMLDCELFELNPLWHHMTNLLLHIANTILLFLVFKKATGAVWRSAFVAALFALHPLNVEPVAWVAERKDVLSTLFFLLTVTAYIRYAKRPAIGTYLLVVSVFALTIMTKPMVVTLPFVLLLLDYWPLNRLQCAHIGQSEGDFPQASASRLIVEKVPLFILSAFLSIVTFIIQRDIGAMALEGELSLKYRIANAAISYVRYIGKIFLPKSLSVLYPHPGSELPIWQSIAAIALLVVISVVILYIGRKRRYLLTGWLWYFGTLVPVIGLIQVGSQSIADRYTYLPAIGIFVIAAWGSNEVFSKWHYRKIALTTTAAVLIFAMLIGTRSQVKLWKDSITLFKHSLAVTRNNYVMHIMLGSTLARENRLEDSIEQFNQALRIDPYSTDAYNHRGIAYAHLKKYDEAIEDWSDSLQLKDNDAQVHIYLADLLSFRGQVSQAIEHWRSSLRLDGNNAQVHCSLANALVQTGQIDQAVSHYTTSLRLNPNQPLAENDLAELLYIQDKHGEAIQHWKRALALEPNSARVLNNLAWIMATHKERTFQQPLEALEYAKKACSLTRFKQPDCLDTLSAAYAAAGEFDEAIRTAEKALKLYQEAGLEKRARDLQNRLELFRKGQPYRE